MISVVIPTLNEISLGILEKSLQILSGHPGCEIICVDGGSTDGTLDLITRFPGVKIVNLDSNSRAVRLNKGIEEASHDMVLLHHPRSIIDPAALTFLDEKKDQYIWGALRHQFDKPNPILDFTSWYSNEVRGKIRGIFYLDHCIFFNKKMISLPAIPDVDIFEDTLLSTRLKEKSEPLLIQFHSKTSSIRFETNGIIYQSILNQLMKILYYLKVPHETMNKIYERGLELNSIYRQK